MATAKVSDKEIERRLEAIRSCYSGGDAPIGPPEFQNEEIVAYTPEQAKIIFRNLMDARVNHGIIPFIHQNAQCARCRNHMMAHMMYHQEIPSEALGVVISLFNEYNPQHPQQRTLEYKEELYQLLTSQKPPTSSYSEHFMFHTAPTINVIQDGEVTPMVLDPSLCDRPATIMQWAGAQMQKSKTVFSPMKDAAFCDKYIEIPKYNGTAGKITEREQNEIADSASNLPPPPQKLQHIVSNRADFSEQLGNAAEYFFFYTGREIHRELQRLAQDEGIESLPNCGPLALRQVRTVLGINKAVR